MISDVGALDLDGVELRNPMDLFRVIRTHVIGDQVPMKVLRDGETLDLTFEFGTRPPL